MKTLFSFFILSLLITSEVMQASAQRERMVEVPRFVLERTLGAWDDIKDYESMIELYEIRPSGETKQFWIHLRAVREVVQSNEVGGTLRMDVYDTELPLSPLSADAIASATPIEFYFITPTGNFYTYSSPENTIVRDVVDTNDPLPQFLQIAGFLNISMEELETRITLGPDVEETEIDGRPAQRITLLPKEGIVAAEPVRQIWIDPKTHLPVQFIVDGSLYIRLKIGTPILNQDIEASSLTPSEGTDYPAGVVYIEK